MESFRAKPACQAQNQGNPGAANRTVRVGGFFLNTALKKEINSPTTLWNFIFLEWHRFLEQICLFSELRSYCLTYKYQHWGLFNLSPYSVADRKALKQQHSLYSLWHSMVSFQAPRNFSIIWMSVVLWQNYDEKLQKNLSLSDHSPPAIFESTINILFTENAKRYCCHL